MHRANIDPAPSASALEMEEAALLSVLRAFTLFRWQSSLTVSGTRALTRYGVKGAAVRVEGAVPRQYTIATAG